MAVRIAAALVGLLVLVPALLLGGNAGVDVPCWFVLAIGVREFTSMALPWRGNAAFGVALGGAVLLFGGIVYGPAGWVAPLLAVVFLGAVVAVMAWSDGLEGAADEVGRLLTGMTYLGLLLAFLPLLRRTEHGLVWVFVLLAATWLGDSGAYFTGRSLGRHRMSPRLSPKKTWEGTLGGAVAAVLGALAVGALFLPGVPLWKIALLGLVIDGAGVLGDLAESLLKRAFGVKDSGRIMPGHGGILDRIDSLLFSGPVLFLFLHLLDLA